jgi:hypothetical protein
MLTTLWEHPQFGGELWTPWCFLVEEDIVSRTWCEDGRCWSWCLFLLVVFGITKKNSWGNANSLTESDQERNCLECRKIHAAEDNDSFNLHDTKLHWQEAATTSNRAAGVGVGRQAWEWGRLEKWEIGVKSEKLEWKVRNLCSHANFVRNSNQKWEIGAQIEKFARLGTKSEKLGALSET